MSSLKAQGTKAFVWDFAGKMVMHGMGFVVSVILARLLEPFPVEWREQATTIGGETN